MPKLSHRSGARLMRDANADEGLQELQHLGPMPTHSCILRFPFPSDLLKDELAVPADRQFNLARGDRLRPQLSQEVSNAGQESPVLGLVVGAAAELKPDQPVKSAQPGL